ncbi:hypothetical protein Lal_00019851 [Lupinus albus]|nr:hypothetical protein Lal_00019851 [Lupinus albus]
MLQYTRRALTEERANCSSIDVMVLKGKGRPRKTISETIRKKLKINTLSVNMIYGRALWCRSIHIVDPT